jgi:hypothetical protein
MRSDGRSESNNGSNNESIDDLHLYSVLRKSCNVKKNCNSDADVVDGDVEIEITSNSVGANIATLQS